MAKIKIKRLHMVASWTWNGPEELCGICHTELDGCAPEAQFPGDDSPVVWGQCTHAFHLSCIDEWCQKQNDAPTCPMCRRPWEIAADNNESNKGAAQHDENVNNISATSESLLMTPLPQTQSSIQPPSSVATPTPLQVNDSDDDEDDELLLQAEHVTTPTSISGISLAPRYHHHDHHHLNSAQHDEEFDELIISRIDPVSEFYRSDSRVNFSLDDDDLHHT